MALIHTYNVSICSECIRHNTPLHPVGCNSLSIPQIQIPTFGICVLIQESTIYSLRGCFMAVTHAVTLSARLIHSMKIGQHVFVTSFWPNGFWYVIWPKCVARGERELRSMCLCYITRRFIKLALKLQWRHMRAMASELTGIRITVKQFVQAYSKAYIKAFWRFVREIHQSPVDFIAKDRPVMVKSLACGRQQASSQLQTTDELIDSCSQMDTCLTYIKIVSVDANPTGIVINISLFHLINI